MAAQSDVRGRQLLEALKTDLANIAAEAKKKAPGLRLVRQHRREETQRVRSSACARCARCIER
jgi:hypothetical protein